MFEKELQGFMKVFARYLLTKNEKLDWQVFIFHIHKSTFSYLNILQKVHHLDPSDVSTYDHLPVCVEERKKELLSKTCFVRLNGGLGIFFTYFVVMIGLIMVWIGWALGYKGSKSSIEIRKNLTLLDLAVMQVLRTAFLLLSIHPVSNTFLSRRNILPTLMMLTLSLD
jgi:UDP-N-acetylglucosamine pyrophosphorylase